MTLVAKTQRFRGREPQIELLRPADLHKFSVYVNAVNGSLTNLFPDDSDLYSAVRSALFTGGKRIRAILALLSCEAVCGDWKRALPIAVAYELAHNASLVQDDIIDRAEKRRTASTVYAEYGLNTAMLASDMLIFEIFKRLVEYRKTRLSRNKMIMLLDFIGESSKATTLGEYLDEELATKDVVYEEEYFEMVKAKTGAMLGALGACGAVVGGGNLKDIGALYRFGEKHGIAYQVQDDVLDIMSDEHVIGKPLFNDLRNRRKNLVLIHALREGVPRDREAIRRLFGRQSLTSREIKNIRLLLLELGSIDYAKDLAQRIAADGRDQLARLKQSVARTKLEELSFAIMQATA